MVSNIFQNVRFSQALLDHVVASDRPRWESVPQELKRQMVSMAETLLEQDWPELPLSLYQDFQKTGNRERFQHVYMGKRRRLSILVIAECLEYTGRFIPTIADGLWSLIGEPAWVIPAHNSYIRDTPQLPCPLTERPILDLFACETGEIVALASALLQEEFDALIGAEFVETLHHQLRVRIINPYLNDYFWWMGGPDDKLNNWTVWCTQNILLTALSLPLAESEKQAVIAKATGSLDLWLDQYGDDGCCDEGASYWHAAGLCFWGCIYILDTVANGTATKVFECEKVRNIARYITNVHVKGDWYLNFADCSPKAGMLGTREYLFGKAIHDDQLIRQALLDWNKDYEFHLIASRPATARDAGDNDYNLWYRLLDCLYATEMRTALLPEERPIAPYIWYQSVGLAIYRFNGHTLAVKAGCNDDSHNHNDVGSLILYDGDHPLLIDVGVETYTRKTFSPQRYTLWPMQSFYHNVCNFGDTMQGAGAQFKATQVNATENGISMELASAYPEKAELQNYLRTITLQRQGVTITETVVGNVAPTLTIMTMDRPTIESTKILFKDWCISYKSDTVANFEEISIEDSRLRQAWPDTLYRILIPFQSHMTWAIETTITN